jgi:hypothetical protein
MNPIVITRMMGLAVLFALALLAAPDAHSADPSTETFTVYQDAPKMGRLDLGEKGNSPGDAYHFFAPLRSSPGRPVTGEVLGSKTLIKLAADAKSEVEKRGTILFFSFGNDQDQIVVYGIMAYSPSAGEFAADKPVVRPVLGGAGKYMGARGQLTSNAEFRRDV